MPKRRPLHHKFVGKLSVDTEFGAFLGDTRIRLLEAIDRYGSITHAAKTVPISYKAAWDAVDAMNNLAEQALVERSAGGRHGGGTVLTDYGRRIVAMYRALEQEYQGAFERLAERLSDVDAADVAQFQNVLRRMSIRTSARNQFSGSVRAMLDSAAGVEVCVHLDAGLEIRALITRESVENLDLRIGSEVHAFAKATAVTLALQGEGEGDGAAAQPANRLCGTVDRILAGALNAEVSLALAGGRSVTAVVGLGALREMGLQTGSACCAVFSPASVILVRFV